MRRAQNDVLAAVGVCIRNSPQSALHDSFSSGSKPDVTEEEDTYGYLITAVRLSIDYAATWWASNLADRVLVCMLHTYVPFQAQLNRVLHQAYRSPFRAPFMHILRTEYRVSGASAFFFAGLPSHLLTAYLDWEFWAAGIVYLTDRAVLTATESRKALRHYQIWRPWLVRT